MGPKGSKRAPGGTAPGGRRFGRPEDGSIRALGKPDLRGSTIMPPLRHLKKMGEQMWQGAAGEEAKEVSGLRMPGTAPLDSSSRHGQPATRAPAGSGQEQQHREHTFPGACGLSFELSRPSESTKWRLLPRPTPKGDNLIKNRCQNLPRSMQNHRKAPQGTTLDPRTSSSSETIHDTGFPVLSLEGLRVIYDSATGASRASG